MAYGLMPRPTYVTELDRRRAIARWWIDASPRTLAWYRWMQRYFPKQSKVSGRTGNLYWESCITKLHDSGPCAAFSLADTDWGEQDSLSNVPLREVTQ